MKSSQIYLNAAKAFAEGKELTYEQHVCTYLVAHGSQNLKESIEFHKMFCDTPSSVYWLHRQMGLPVDATDKSGKLREKLRPMRVLMLCMMAAIAADEERGRK